jgi:hypothetical protein
MNFKYFCRHIRHVVSFSPIESFYYVIFQVYFFSFFFFVLLSEPNGEYRKTKEEVEGEKNL